MERAFNSVLINNVTCKMPLPLAGFTGAGRQAVRRCPLGHFLRFVQSLLVFYGGGTDHRPRLHFEGL